ncbi:MAG TPA: PAS domain S-box protein, partial [Gemmatimonadales bacterium]|nr:PAS domain S-box protein [Gemmatimonadales bacterium]
MSNEDLRAVELRLRAAVESSPSGLLMVDADGRIVLLNREIERLFGYAREELLGRPVDLLVPAQFRSLHPDYRSKFLRQPMTRAMGAGRDLFGLRKDGTQVPVEIGLTPVVTEEGLFVISSIVDISARKAAEAGRRLLENQLRQAQKMEAVGTLAGGIAHDFNNVLAAIVGYAELAIENGHDRPALVQDLRRVLAAAERGRSLVERILRFSRQTEPRRQPVDVGEVVREASQMLRSTLPASIDLQVSVAPDVPRTLADLTALHQVVTNLCTNAAHAMPGGGTLHIALEYRYIGDSAARSRPDFREGPYLILTVRDTGHGMDRETLDRALEPFFTTKPPGTGSGLGLTMVHGIVRDHAGALDLESRPGAGTTVRCYFPAPPVDGHEDLRIETRARRGTGQRVLYLDDEESLAELGRRRLQGIGYRVAAYTDPTAALSALRADPDGFDLVVTDYWMPHMVGLDFARAATAVRPDLPVLLLTGHMDDLPEEAVRAA